MERGVAMVQPAQRVRDIAVDHAPKVRDRRLPNASASQQRFGRSPRLQTQLLEREGVA
jgi:hypothetical protein